MATFQDVLTAATAVKDSVAAGRFVDAWEQTFPLQQFGIDACRAMGLKSNPSDAQCKQQVRECLEECERLCQNPPMSSQQVGVIGDGKIVQAILALVTTLLPLFS